MLSDGFVSNQKLLDERRQRIEWPQQLSLFTVSCETIVIDYSPFSEFRTCVSKKSKFAGNVPPKFISSRFVGFESSAHNLPEGREAENAQTDTEVSEYDAVVIGETSNSPAKAMYVLQNARLQLSLLRQDKKTKIVI